MTFDFEISRATHLFTIINTIINFSQIVFLSLQNNSRELFWPRVITVTKFHLDPAVLAGTKYLNCLGHMSKIAVTIMYGKYL